MGSSEYWIIGYGNSQRRDDGLGPYIVDRLRLLAEYCNDVHLLTLHQLEPDLIDTLKNARTIVFVDAIAKKPARGQRWIRVAPELHPMPCLTHQVTPALLLRWLQILYGRHPTAWLVSVTGHDFSFGIGLSLAARRRAGHIIREIADFVSTPGQDRSKKRPTVPKK